MATQNAIGRLDTTQNLAITTSPATSNPVPVQTYKIRLAATVACNISIGNAANVLLPANLPEYFQCTPGQSITAAALTGTGNLCITGVI
jgi:hypothetical protein